MRQPVESHDSRSDHGASPVRHNRTAFLKPLVTHPRIEVGEYTYYDDEEGATAFQQRNVLYAYGPETSSLASTARSPRVPDS
jgi:hypothetical protein